MDQDRPEDQERCPNRSISIPHLRRLRQSRALSQRQLGELAGVSPGTIYRLETELRGAYPVTVSKLAAALRVTPEELVRKPHHK